MTQHQLLMVVAPPLLLLGAPSVAMLWAFPIDRRRMIARGLHIASRSPMWRLVSNPLSAFALHASAIWLWHMPVLYEQTLFSDSMHALQHLSFTLTALLFWWTVLQPRTHGAAARGLAVLSLFATAAHGSILAALLTFSSRPWYLAYAGRTDAWGLTLLEDQQLGGLIMWVPTGVVYTAAALMLFWSSLRAMERRDASRVTSVRQAHDRPAQVGEATEENARIA
jgi:putative membrane protein